jgi:hypothetical protein
VFFFNFFFFSFFGEIWLFWTKKLGNFFIFILGKCKYSINFIEIFVLVKFGQKNYMKFFFKQNTVLLILWKMM